MTDGVRPDAKRPAGGDRRVLLAQRPGGRVAGVHERRQPLRGPLLVHPGETGQRQVHLAAHLDDRRRLLAAVQAQAQRDRLDGAQVRRHVLANLAVAARRPANEHPSLVHEGDRKPVDLRLDHPFDRLVAEHPHRPLRPRPELVVAAGVAKREHRLQVAHLGEVPGGWARHPLGRRVGDDEVGMGRLQLAQLAHQGVVVGVVQRRLVEHVVAMVGVVDQRPQLSGTLGRGAHRSTSCGRSNSRSGCSASSSSRLPDPQSTAAVATPAACPQRMSQGASPT